MGMVRSTKLAGLDLSNAASLVSIGDYSFDNTDITGTLMIPANVETIGWASFYKTKVTGLDLSNAASLVSIGGDAFKETNLEGTLVIPANATTIGYGAFWMTKLTGLGLSNAASLEAIGDFAFADTNITGTIKTPFTVPTIEAKSFPAGVSIVSIVSSEWPVILEGSTAGFRCIAAWTMIDTAAECKVAAYTLMLTWEKQYEGVHYQDGCSVYAFNGGVGVYFNPLTVPTVVNVLRARRCSTGTLRTAASTTSPSVGRLRLLTSLRARPS